MYQHVSGGYSCYCLTGFCWLSQNDHHYKMASEANTFKKRMERAEAKLVSLLPATSPSSCCSQRALTQLVCLIFVGCDVHVTRIFAGFVLVTACVHVQSVC